MSEQLASIDTLILEATRRCNLRCAHCLRGEAEQVDMSEAIIRAAFKGLRYISNLTITGGEPGLVPHVIQKMLDVAKEEDVEIGNFYIATNGTTATDEFMRVLMELWMFCSDNETSRVEISESIFHRSCGQDSEAIRRLECFRFVSHREDLNPKYVIAEGRGVEQCDLNGTIEGAKTVHARAWEIYEDEEDLLPDQPYVNVYGSVLSECDFSYARQEENADGNIIVDSWKEIIARNQRRRPDPVATPYPKEEWLKQAEPTMGGQPA